jgi:hypothetical protein
MRVSLLAPRLVDVLFEGLLRSVAPETRGALESFVDGERLHSVGYVFCVMEEMLGDW